MTNEDAEDDYPIIRYVMIGAGFAALVFVGMFVIPQVVDEITSKAMKSSGSLNIPDEGPEIVRNDDASTV